MSKCPIGTERPTPQHGRFRDLREARLLTDRPHDKRGARGAGAPTNVPPADGKAGAWEVLGEALASRLGDPEHYLDFESIREIVPETHKSWRQEIRDQLFGSNGATKERPVVKSQS